MLTSDQTVGPARPGRDGSSGDVSETPDGGRPRMPPECRVPASQTILEQGRWCGLRIRSKEDAEAPDDDGRGRKPSPPAVYFVDELTRVIDELFCELLEEHLEKESGGRAPGRGGRAARRGGGGRKAAASASSAELRQARAAAYEELRRGAAEKLDRSRQQGAPQFAEAMRAAKRLKRAWAELPPPLASVAERRGALVVFKEPYPSFQKSPRAEFLGVLRLDGDLLLKDILAFYRAEGAGGDVSLPYCGGDEPRPRAGQKKGAAGGRGAGQTEAAAAGAGKAGRIKKGQLVVEMATSLKVSKALGGQVLDWLGRRIAEELQGGRTFNLRNVGTFRVGRKGGRHVAFRPSDVLKAAVAEGGVQAGGKRNGAKGKK